MPPVSTQTLEGLTARLLTLGLVHASWIAVFLAAATAIVFQLSPRLSHRTRHALLASALIGTFLGPCLAVAVQRARIASHDVERSASVRVSVSRAEPVETTQVEWEAPAPMPSKPESGFSISIGRIWMDLVEMIEITQPYVLGIWLVAVVSFSLRLVLAGWAVRRLIRDSEPAASEIQARTNELAARLGLRRVLPVLVHPDLDEPGICGLFRPRILLPRTWLDGSIPNQLDAILAHELAHAKRRDLPANLAQRLVETALFFHPAVRWISNTLRRERELCTDALAVALTGNPVALASALESVARLRLSASSSRLRTPMLGASIGGEGPSLLPRIQELLGMTPTLPARRSLWPWASIPAAGFLAILGATLGLANDPPAPLSLPAGQEPNAITPNVAVATEPSPNTRPLPIAKVPLKPRTLDPQGLKISIAPHVALPHYSDRQISYEIQMISMTDLAWRDRLADRMREIHRDAETSAWLLDQKTSLDFLKSMQSDAGYDALRAPKVTAFEGDRALIDSTIQVYYVADVEKLKSPSFRPIIKTFDSGRKIHVSGLIRGASIKMDLDLRDTWPIVFYTRMKSATIEAQPQMAAATISATSQIPVLANRHFQCTQDIAEGSSLLISTGYDEERREIPPLMHRAIGIVQAVLGGPPVEAERVIRERLVMITPRKILLAPEEIPDVRPSSDVKSSTSSKQPTPNSLPIDVKGEDREFTLDKTLTGYYRAVQTAEGSKSE